MRITLIGDVHGKTEKYLRIVQSLPAGQVSIQLGDMGLGFQGVFLPHLTDVAHRHLFIRGNHDSPELCRKHPNYLGEYGYLQKEDIFYVAGAYSIDKAYRIPGVSWWPDEELSATVLNDAITLYEKSRPRIVISHDCPSTVNMKMLVELSGGVTMYGPPSYFEVKRDCAHSRTCYALEAMLRIHQPESWFFGHYHVDKIFKIGPTTFRCLAELSTTEIEIPLDKPEDLG